MARLVLEQRMAPRPGGDLNDLHEVFTVIEPFRVAHRLTGVVTVLSTPVVSAALLNWPSASYPQLQAGAVVKALPLVTRDSR